MFFPEDLKDFSVNRRDHLYETIRNDTIYDTIRYEKIEEKRCPSNIDMTL